MDHAALEILDSELTQAPLLLIDDSPENLALLRKTLSWGGFHNVRCCQSGAEGLAVLDEHPPHLIILDLMMPGMSGFEFLEAIREKEISGAVMPILVFTADLTPKTRTRALELGASDFLTKPGDAIEIKLRVRNFLRTRHVFVGLEQSNLDLEAKVLERTQRLAAARKEAIDLLAKASEYRDDDTGQHSHRVGEMSAAIAEQLGMDAQWVKAIRLVAPLHDIGKIAIPDNILHKAGPLTDDEYALMKQHVSIGGELLAANGSPLLQFAREIVLYHHERWDGKGYLAGLSGDEIPISARIVSVADTFDAITNNRPYRKARSESEAVSEITAMAGSQFDPSVVNALVQICPAHVELSLAA